MSDIRIRTEPNSVELAEIPVCAVVQAVVPCAFRLPVKRCQANALIVIVQVQAVITAPSAAVRFESHGLRTRTIAGKMIGKVSKSRI